MTIGRQDFLFEPNEVFSKEMQALPLDYTYEVFEGSHDWRFWDLSLEAALNKYYPVG
jgi:enterochelin esterase-like enzyme